MEGTAATQGGLRCRNSQSISDGVTRWKPGATIFNLFVEPQWTAFHHDGIGFPEWTIFAGLNMTFGK